MISQSPKVVFNKDAFSPLHLPPNPGYFHRAGFPVSLRMWAVPLVLVTALYSSQSARAQDVSGADGNKNISTALPQEREVLVTAQRGAQISFNIGSDDGVSVGTEFEVRRNGASPMRVRVLRLSATQNTAQILGQSPDAANLTVGERVRVVSFAPSTSTLPSSVAPETSST
ncbi:MAG: hypothetical protein EOP06_24835, partial [Proteobacteria bacterium]